MNGWKLVHLLSVAGLLMLGIIVESQTYAIAGIGFAILGLWGDKP